MLVLEADRARMSQIDSQIRDLWKERKLLRERFDGYKYPVLTLPNEIVSEIFSRFLPVYPLRPPAIDLLYPTILGQICRKWRQIALSTPVLWRAIALTFPEDDPPEPRIQLLATWLNRSGSFPLSIKVDDQFKVTKQNQLVRTIVPHCARWEYLALTLPMADLLFIKGHMPLLRGFETWHLMLPLIALPWTQLTTLIVSNVEQDRCADILKHAFNVVHCELGLFSFRGNHISPVNIKPLHRLKVLVLSRVFDKALPGDPVGLLHALTLPALRRLQILEGSWHWTR